MRQLRFKDYLVVVGGILLIALSISFAHVNPVEPGPKPQDVNVVNTPLPVTGTVNVGNFPATQSVSGSVGITGTPDVRDADNAARAAYVDVQEFSISGSVNNIVNFASVPVGKRLVIEYVYVSCNSSNSDSFPTAAVQITRNLGGGVTATFAAADLTVKLRGLAPFSGSTFTGSEQTQHLYSDGGNSPALNVFHTDATTTPQCVATMSGYTVTL